MFWGNAFFVGWVALMALRGYVRGFWVSLFDLLGLFMVCVACMLYVGQIVAWLQQQGFPLYLACLIGFAAVFAAVSVAIAVGQKALFAKVLKKRRLLTWQGGALGAVAGAFSSLVLIWCLNFANGVLFSEYRGRELAMAQVPLGAQGQDAPLVLRAANRLMVAATALGAKATGASRVQASLLVSAVRAPAAMTRDLRQVLQSPALRQFYADSQVQSLMIAGAHEQLVASRQFQQLLQQPAVRALREPLLRESGSGLIGEAPDETAVDHYLARQLSSLWQRVSVVADDAEVQAYLRDREVQRLLENNQLADLLSHPKTRHILGKLMEQNDGFAEVDDPSFNEGANTAAKRTQR